VAVAGARAAVVVVREAVLRQALEVIAFALSAAKEQRMNWGPPVTSSNVQNVVPP